MFLKPLGSSYYILSIQIKAGFWMVLSYSTKLQNPFQFSTIEADRSVYSEIILLPTLHWWVVCNSSNYRGHWFV